MLARVRWLQFQTVLQRSAEQLFIAFRGRCARDKNELLDHGHGASPRAPESFRPRIAGRSRSSCHRFVAWDGAKSSGGGGRGSLGAFGAGAPEPKGLQAVFFFKLGYP